MLRVIYQIMMIMKHVCIIEGEWREWEVRGVWVIGYWMCEILTTMKGLY